MTDRSSIGPVALRLDGIAKSFPGVRALDGVSLDVERGTIHGILGENGAGKSTLMNVIFGFLRPDQGRIEVDGHPLELRGPRDAIANGIGMVHQHFMLVPDMTVAENVALGRAGWRRPRVDLDRLAEQIAELGRANRLDVDPRARVDQLSVGEQQRVEILKLLHRDARIIVLDEPTAVLTALEWDGLRAVLRKLADEGRTILFITHKLDELIHVADRATVLRHGRVVGTVERDGFDKALLARMMVGRDVTIRVDRPAVERGVEVLEVAGLRADGDDGVPALHGVDLTVRAGEVVAIAGVDGNGQAELVDVLSGMRPATAGSVTLTGRPLGVFDPGQFRRRGGAIVPGDRASSALAMELSILENLLLDQRLTRSVRRRGVLDLRRAREYARRLVSTYDVRAPDIDATVGFLSGGNQQKVVLARELEQSPRLLIAAQPTRGVDIGACEFIYSLLMKFRADGGAVLLVSTELEEILAISDRVHVMLDGRLTPAHPTESLTIDDLGLMIGGEEAA